MELRDYIEVLRKRWRLIALLTGLALGGGLAASLLATPQYAASTQLFVSAQASASASDLLQGSNFTQQRVKSYAQIVTSPLVLAPVVDRLDLGVTAEELAEQVSAEAPPDTVLINVSVRDESPETASRVANAVGDSFIRAVRDLDPGGEAGSPVQVTTVRPARVPDVPVSPDIRLNLALALLVGLGLGAGAAVLRETLDTRVRCESDVHGVTGASVLGGIAFDETAATRPLIVHSSPRSGRSEAFRQLRTNLQFVDVTNHPKSFVITSSVSGEGKSTTAANLALTLAAAGSRVCLVEADLRRPKVADYLGLDNAVGLTTVLIGQGELADVVQPWGDGYLHVLASGQVPPNPSELLGSSPMQKLLSTLEASYDAVLIDAPPLLPVTDAAILSKLTGGAVVVVGSGRVNRDQLAKALSNLDAVGARVFGLVLNMLPSKGTDAETYYTYGYASESA